LTEPALGLGDPGIGDASLRTAYLLGVKKLFCGDCIFSAALALIGRGIFVAKIKNNFSNP
jgi:hypothetical protein